MLAQLSRISLRFGPQTVLKEVNWSLNEGERWGVIGRNGSGKSTLFRLLLGELEADQGHIVRPSAERGIRLGYYAQDLIPETHGTVLEEALAAFKEVEALQHAMRELEHRMGEVASEELESVMARYQEASEAFERLDGFAIRAKAESILQSLGFEQAQFLHPVEELSGGQKSRVMLAKAILKGQDLLLLDEPTNHLDLPSLRWLEQFLVDSRSTLAVISHDRYFLDGVATDILELELGQSRTYSGNYSEFMDKKEQELEAQQRAWEAQQAFIKKQEEFIRRNIAGVNTKQARGRRTHLERMDRLHRPLSDRRKVKFQFPETQRCGDVALVVDDLSVGYEGKALFQPISHLQIRRGMKVGVVGFNGTGKSTLLRVLSEELPALSGSFRLGSQVKLGYFDQHHRNLDARNTVFQQIQAVVPLAPKQDVLGFLAKFQFRGDEVDKPVTVLSGGERARLSVATLIREGVNLLLLDEPTNHMDILSMEAMEDALVAFPGAILLATHDRYLLGRVADCLLRIHEGSAEFREGGYEEHQAWVDLDLGHEPVEEEPSAKTEPKPMPSAKPSEGKREAIDKEKQKLTRRREKLLAEAEAKVEELETRLTQLQEELASLDPSDWQCFNEKLNAQKELEMELAYALQTWEEHQQFLDEML